ncbi:Uncharacterised protein [Bordetella trematum]|uniref:hypothetical protein n=1 Tax=Bordetella trematum TaxID=123899 RepID=UPI000799A2C8|nr:hypothetical protein [Bordetella trematum]SAI62942.1 Uncharacterised protein [Bordetella trematum]
MIKVAMPQPFILVQNNPWGGHAEVIRSARGGDGVIDCYTTDQMEAYATAKVREALEEAAQACEARIGTHAPGMTPEDVEDCDEEARICADVIRALVPSTPA